MAGVSQSQYRPMLPEGDIRKRLLQDPDVKAKAGANGGNFKTDELLGFSAGGYTIKNPGDVARMTLQADANGLARYTKSDPVSGDACVYGVMSHADKNGWGNDQKLTGIRACEDNFYYVNGKPDSKQRLAPPLDQIEAKRIKP